MDLVRDFNSEIYRVLEDCKSIVASYPQSLRERGMAYLSKLHLLSENGNISGGFAYLMPFWLRDSFALKDIVCHKLALGNIFALLYFLTQDEVMDSNESEYKGDILPLSSLFFLDFTAQYRSLFSSEAPFWEYFNKYFEEWAESVLWERRKHLGKVSSYSEEDFLLLARKAAPLKIPFAAICILADREDLIQGFSDMLDNDQVTYQMIDDWWDWEEDLDRKNLTFLLVLSMEYCNIAEPSKLDRGHVKRAVYAGDTAEKVFSIAKQYNARALECIKSIGCPYLETYLELEDKLCDDILKMIQEQSDGIFGGGISALIKKAMETKAPENER